jgi:hypothetical protein
VVVDCWIRTNVSFRVMPYPMELSPTRPESNRLVLAYLSGMRPKPLDEVDVFSCKQAPTGAWRWGALLIRSGREFDSMLRSFDGLYTLRPPLICPSIVHPVSTVELPHRA